MSSAAQFAPMRSNALILPVLVCAGVVLGLALTHTKGDPGEVAVAPEPVRATDRGPLHAVAEPATATENPIAADSRDASQERTDTPHAKEGPALGRQPTSDPERTQPTGASPPSYDESSVTLADVHEIPAEVSGATDANVRARALREMSESSSPDAFPLLEQTLRTDAIARNRLLAVNSIRLLGKQGGNAERARDALRLALSDRDENVAASAHDAYQELSR
jgi:hypothetical protein